MSLDLYIYENMLKLIIERENALTESILYGPVEDFSNFKEQKARLLELATLKQDLKSLLEKVTDNESNST